MTPSIRSTPNLNDYLVLFGNLKYSPAENWASISTGVSTLLQLEPVVNL